MSVYTCAAFTFQDRNWIRWTIDNIGKFLIEVLLAINATILPLRINLNPLIFNLNALAGHDALCELILRKLRLWIIMKHIFVMRKVAQVVDIGNGDHFV